MSGGQCASAASQDHQKALNPNEQIAQHFAAGETFGVYGDVMPAQSQEPPKPEEDKIPVTILTGFLGSGKTTLLNYILQARPFCWDPMGGCSRG